MRPFSLEGKLALLLLLAVVAGAGAAVLLELAIDSDLLAFVVAVAVTLPLVLLVARVVARPISELFRTLSGAVASFRDGDFSFSIHRSRNDELGDLVGAHNELGRVLRDERQDLFQRELLLHTVVQNTPNALILADSRDHVVYSNVAARQLLNGGRRLEGLTLAQVLAESPAALREAVDADNDAIFPVRLDGEDESFHLATRAFRLNGQPHRLLLLRHMTRELSRQEVATWKKVIRVISHELNNSLAPITSLAHSGHELAARVGHAAIMRAFDTIGERAGHLERFIRGYATFAKLPTPQIEAVAWEPFLGRLREQYPCTLSGTLPATPGRFDAAQVGQVLINLLKNAHESGSAGDAVEMEVRELGTEVRIEVRDRGSGMSEAVMANALVPFYSTKRTGTGLGLALAREIAEAHGGRLGLANREGGGLAVTLSLPR
jgi:nitrogen fixation/metabolism regulation signal transduction histidine kinase